MIGRHFGAVEVVAVFDAVAAFDAVVFGDAAFNAAIFDAAVFDDAVFDDAVFDDAVVDDGADSSVVGEPDFFTADSPTTNVSPPRATGRCGVTQTSMATAPRLG